MSITKVHGIEMLWVADQFRKKCRGARIAVGVEEDNQCSDYEMKDFSRRF